MRFFVTRFVILFILLTVPLFMGASTPAGEPGAGDGYSSFSSLTNAQYTITSTAGSNGSISPSGAILVDSGATQAFTITPNTGYHIDSVLVDGSNVGAVTNYSFPNVGADHSISASYSIDQFIITSSAGANGTIAPLGATIVNFGGSQAYTLTPNTGYHVDSLLVDGANQGQLTTFTFNAVNANHTIRAVFAINQYTLTATTGANGTIAPLGATVVNFGGSQAYTLTPNTGYHVDSLIVDGTNQGQLTTFTFNAVNANHTIRAVFAINQYTLTATTGANGTIAPLGATIVNFGASQAYTLTPNTGYHVDSLLVDGTNQGQLTTFTFNAVNANHTIRAVFAINQYTLTATTGANGTIAPLGATVLNFGASQAYTLTPNTGYHVDSLLVDGANQGQLTTFTFNAVNANHTIRAVFAINQFAIVASTGANGSIAPSGTVLVNFGASQAFTSTPTTGYHIDSVIVDGVFVGAPPTYTFTNVTATHTIRSVFAINQFTITSSTGANGSIAPLGATVVNYGSSQLYTLTPNTGYHVDSLLVDGVNQGALPSFNFTNVTVNHTIRAVFAIDRFTITATAGANGTLSPSGAVLVNYGSSQAFTITPNTGYHIDSVIVDGVNLGQLASYTFTNVTTAHSIRTVYAINTFTITSSTGTNGTIAPLGATIVNYGSSQSYTLTPNTGYHVDSLIVDGSNQGQAASFTFTNVTANHAIRAVFAINQFTITSSAGANGSISPSGSVNENFGATQAFTITPNTGYHVDSVIVDGVNQGGITSFSFSNITANHTIRAVFAINQFTITSSAGVNGTIAPLGATIVSFGASQGYTVTPNTGYHVDSLLVDGANQGQLTIFTFNAVNANHTIRAVFAINQYTITSSTGANGTIAPLGATIVTFGANQSYTITPNTGYHVDSLIVDGANQGQLTSFSFNAVSANHTIRAVFAITQFTITATAAPNGSIAPSGAVIVNYGSNQSFTITPNSGYHIDSVRVDGVSQGAIASYTFTAVTAAHSINAFFSINQYTITSSAGANGTIAPLGATIVNSGANQSYTIIPNSGYHVDSLIVDGANQGQLTTFTFTAVTASHTIRAVFAVTQFTITSSAGANGSIAPLGATFVNSGANQSYTITPNTGYHVDSLIVDGANQGQLTTFTFNAVSANHTIRAAFAINQFTITSSAGTNGTIAPLGATIVNFGASQAYTVTPNTGYHVDSLLVDGANQGQLTSFTFNAVSVNHTIRAVFAINQYTITSSTGANGTIAPLGATLLNFGANQSYTITPNTGYHIDSVLVDGTNQGAVASYTFNAVAASHTIRAVFAINQYAITATAGPNGSLSPSGAVLVNHGANQAFSITPNTGYHIDSVIVDGTNLGPLASYTFTNVTAPHTIRGVFAITQFTITSSAGANGSIAPLGATVVNYGSNQSYTMTPTTGYHVDSLIVDGVNQGGPGSFTFTNVTANHTIRAVFAIDRFTITATAGANGTLTPSGAVLVNYGSNQAFSVSANTGYHIDSVIVDGANLGALASYTFTNVTAAHTIRAVFAINQFTITSSTGANGTIAPLGATIVNYGSNQSYTLTPNTGYHVDSLIVDGANQGQGTSFTFTNVTANHTIRAVFVINAFTITATAGSNGSISPSGSVNENFGATQAFTITPNTGYHVDSVIVDGVNQGGITSYTFTNVTANHTITAVFAINQFTITSSAGSNGTIAPLGATIVNFGLNQAYTVTPNTGYHVDSLLVDGANQGQITTFTFSSVAANHTIRAVFAINQYTLTSSTGANGTIAPPGVTVVNFGANQSYTITPNTGYHVDSLIVDGLNQGQLTSYTFTAVSANHSIRSVFAINQYTITATAAPNGTISPSGAVIVNSGANQSFTIAPNTGYHLDSVVVDGANQGPIASYTFTSVTAAHTISAFFSINQFTITSSAGANGAISPLGATIVNYGSNQSYTITPNSGFHVDSLIVDGTNQGPLTSYTFNAVTAGHTIRAVFAVTQFSITSSAGPNGAIAPLGTTFVNSGANQSYTITPNTGYHVDSLIVDGTTQGQLTSYTFTAVSANHTIRAVLAINQFTITSTSGANGTIAPLGSTIVNYGANQSYTVTPNTGYHVDSLIVDGTTQGQLTSYTFTAVTANHTIRAVFAINQYTITSSAGPNGSIAPLGSTVLNFGANQSYTITPITGYHIDSVIVDGAMQGTPGSYTFTSVAASHTIRAVFAINQYTITATAGPNGSLSPSGAVLVNHGSNQAFSILPSTGYHIDSVFVDGVSIGATAAYIFTNVTSAHTIRGVFAIDQFTITSSAGVNGSIAPLGTTTVAFGSNQSYTMTPVTGYHVDSVIVDGVNQGSLPSFTFTGVAANHTIRAVFAIDGFTITATAGANGAISPSGAVVVNYGANQIFAFSPNTGYHTDSIIVDGVNLGALGSYTFTTVTTNHTIRAVFAINSYTITSSAGANGAIAPLGSTVLTYSSNQSYTITPNTGYHVDSLLVDGANQGQLTSFTFTNVSANHTIRAVFAINAFTINATAGANGSITPNGSVNANFGGSQTFTITPNTGYHIDSVIVDGASAGPVGAYTFTNIIANHTIRAVFAINQFSINSTAGLNGAISPNGSTSVNYGSSQSYTITPNTGYHVDSLIVDGANQGQLTAYTFTNVIAPHAIRAVFAINAFTIAASAGANGAINPTGSVNANFGDTLAFTITPNTGYHVDSLIVDGTNQGALTTFTFTNITTNHTIRALFAINQYALSATAGANGTIAPSSVTIVPFGASQGYVITPNTGYHVDSVIVDGVYVGAVGAYTFTSVTANHTIRAVFAINQFAISATAGANGTIAPPSVTIVPFGASQGYVITPNTGYHIDSVIVDGVNAGPVGTYTFTNVTANHTIRSVYAINQLTITATAGAGGAISPNGPTIVNFGANQSFTITPNTGYHIDSVVVDGANQGAVPSYTFTSVTAGHAITAYFSINQYTIAASAGANGSIAPPGTTTLSYGANQSYTMSPLTGYHVDSLFVDGVDQGHLTFYTFSAVASNHAIRAVFAINQYPITVTAGANGTIAPPGPVLVTNGTNQSFTITPSTGYHIDSVFIDGVSIGATASYTFTNVTSPHSIRAAFAINQFTVTSSSGPNGSIAPLGAVSVNFGTNQTFTLTPSTGYHVDSIQVDGVFAGQSNPFTLTNVTANHTVRAVFAIDQFPIAASAGANGSITPSGTVLVNYSANQFFSITPNVGYHIDSVSVDGVFLGQVPTYTFTNVTSPHTIRAAFAIDQLTIASSSGAHGTISPVGAVTVLYGSNQAFSFAPDSGYHVDSVIVDGTNIGPLPSYTFTNVTGNHTIRTSFALNSYTIAASAGTNGSITPSGAVAVAFAGSQSFTISPVPGYHIDSVLVDGVNQGGIGSYAFTNVTANHSIRAVFAINPPHTIIATAHPNGTVTPAGSVVVADAGSQLFTITPNTGYFISDVHVDSVSVGAVPSYAFSNVVANHSIEGFFSVLTYTVSASAGPHGTLTPPGVQTLNYGANLSYSLTPDPGYHIDSLIVDGANVGALPVYNFINITANHTIRAVFAVNQYTLSATAGANGTISPPSVTIVPFGASQSYVITPNTGYHIDSVLVDGANQGPLSSYTFTSVAANHTIRAVFAIDQFTIVSSAGANGGITPVGISVVNYGASQAFTVTPAIGYHVDSLIVDGATVGQLPTYTFLNVTANHTIRAVFAINQYTIVATSSPNGTISPSGSLVMNYGTNLGFTLTANTGYHIDSVIVDGLNQGQLGSYTFNSISANHTIRAVFAINRYTITATSGVNGTITPAGAILVDNGTNQSFAIVPALGYHVDSVIVDGVNQGQIPGYTFTNVTADHSIRAVFAVTQFTITSASGPNGSVVPGGFVVVNYGANQTFAVTPNTGYHVDSVIVDGTSQGPISAYAFNNITSNHTIRAVFAVNQYVLTASAGGNGSITPAGLIPATYGASQTFTFTPVIGYHVDSVIVDGANQGGVPSYTFASITANHTIRATFAINQYSLTALSGPNGSITPGGVTTRPYGSSQSYTLAAGTGYHIDSLIVDDINQGAMATYTFTSISADHIIRAVFAINQYPVTATAGANGTIAPAGVVLVNYGASKTFVATGNTGYHNDSMIVDGVNQGAIDSFTITNVTGPHTIRAVFAVNRYTITATSGPNGSINPSGAVIVTHGANQLFNMVPVSGFRVDSVFVDSLYVGGSSSYYFSAVTRAHTISVKFTLNIYNITATAGPNGTISPSGVVAVTRNANQLFTITPNSGYRVDSLFVDSVSVPPATAYTFSIVTGPHTIRATFAISQFTIMSSTGFHGTITPMGTLRFSFGASQTYAMTAEAGYHIADVIVDGGSAGPMSSYTFSNISANHTIAALYALNVMTISASAGSNGAIIPDGDVPVAYGGEQSFSIRPIDLYGIDSVFVDGVYAGSSPTYDFTNVLIDHTIYVTFKPLPLTGLRYRSFMYDSLFVKTATKKKPISSYWEFKIVNENATAITELNIQFKFDVKEIISSGTLVPTGVKRDWVFAGTMAPHDTVIIKGRSVKPLYEVISKLWLGPISGIPIVNKFPRVMRYELPMPNIAAIRDDAFSRGAFAPTGGLVVGVPRPDDPTDYGWVRLAMSFNMFESQADRTGRHIGTPRGFDIISSTGRPFTREQQNLPPLRHNNKLFADLMTLKFNIAISALRITPLGFGELRYLENGSPYDSMLVRDIAANADSSMTFLRSDEAFYETLDQTVSRINASFSGGIDTSSWGDSLKLTGVREVGDVPFLEKTNVYPVIIQPLAQPIPQEFPTSFELAQNYPNPFNPATTIQFRLGAYSEVTLKVYDMIGKEITTLFDAVDLDAGIQEVNFNASGLASGVYFYRLVSKTLETDDAGNKAGQYTTITKKMLLVR